MYEDKIQENKSDAMDHKATTADKEKKYFLHYPERKEESGHIKHYISEQSLRPYFELFIWEDEGRIIRFDIYYDLSRDEKVIVWKEGAEHTYHSGVTSEKEKTGGYKQSQTQIDIDVESDSSLKEKFRAVLEETKLRKESDQKFLELLDFVYANI